MMYIYEVDGKVAVAKSEQRAKELIAGEKGTLIGFAISSQKERIV